jgi:hypothetical protein
MTPGDVEMWVCWGRESGLWIVADWGPDRELLERKAFGYPTQPTVVLPAGQRPETHTKKGARAHAD